MRRYSPVLILAVVLLGAAPASAVDYDDWIRHSRYYDIVKETDDVLKKTPDHAKAQFARAAALNGLFAFEEAQDHFQKAKAAGIRDGDSLGGNTFPQWSAANDACVQYLPLKVSVPAGQSSGYHVGVRALGKSRHVQVAEKMLPRLVKEGEQFFGVRMDRLMIFMMPDGDSADAFWDKTKVSISMPDQGRGASAVKTTVHYFEKPNDAQSDERIEQTLAHEMGHVLHTLRNKEKALYGAQHPVWFIEGLAVHFAAHFQGVSASKQRELYEAERAHVGAHPYNAFLDFQDNSRSHLNYLTASLMVNEVIGSVGREGLLRVIDTVAQDEPYAEAPAEIEKLTGVGQEALFNLVVKGEHAPVKKLAPVAAKAPVEAPAVAEPAASVTPAAAAEPAAPPSKPSKARRKKGARSN